MPIPVTEAFEAAVAVSKTLPEKPDNDTLLKLYSLYKQATSGDAPEASSAGMFDFIGKAKYEAWKQLKGIPAEEAQKEYIALVNKLKAT